MKEKLLKWRSLILEAVLAIAASLGCFFLVYTMANVVGSTISGDAYFQNFARVFPIVMMGILSIYALFAYHAYRHALDGRKASLIMIVNGLVGVVLATIALLYLLIQMIRGYYPSFSGYPTVGFPIDVIIYLLVEEFAFLAYYLYGLWLKKRESLFPILVTKKPRLHGLWATLYAAGAIAALYFFGGFLMGLDFGINAEHAFAQITVVIALILPMGVYAYREIEKAHPLGKKETLIAAIVITGVCVLAMVLFYVARFTDPRGYVEVSSPYYAADYMLSLAASPLFTLLTLGGMISLLWIDYVHKS